MTVDTAEHKRDQAENVPVQQAGELTMLDTVRANFMAGACPITRLPLKKLSRTVADD